MSNLYLDQLKKIEVYKKRIVDQYLQEGKIIDKLQLQKKIDEIDTKVAVFFECSCKFFAHYFQAFFIRTFIVLM
jgi:hypothetical protein